MQAPVDAGRFALWVCVVAAVATAGGCRPPWTLYDAEALGGARKLLVMPAVGAPGGEGPRAGPVQTGLLITVLDQTGRFAVEGPGRSRQLVSAATSSASTTWARDVQADLAGELDADLIVVCEVIDFRATTETKQQSYYFGQRTWTESTYWAGVSVRLIGPTDGRLVYFGTGEGSSKVGYGPALLDATRAALIGVTDYLARNPAPQTPAGRASP